LRSARGARHRTARAFQVNAEAGTYAAWASGLHGAVAALTLPLFVRLLRRFAG